MIGRNESQFSSPISAGPFRPRSVPSSMLRLAGDHPFAFWIPTLLMLVSGVAITVADSLGCRFTLIIFRGAQPSIAEATLGEQAVQYFVEGPDPTIETSPLRLGLFLGVTMMGSLVAGLTIARLADSSDTSFQSIEEVKDHVQIPVLGTVPINSSTR